jgi:hypothetical protein
MIDIGVLHVVYEDISQHSGTRYTAQEIEGLAEIKVIMFDGVLLGFLACLTCLLL